MKHQAVTVVLALLFVALAAASGPYRRAALVGATTAGVTALGSMVAMGRAARTDGPTGKRVLAVFGLAFLVRIVLVAVGTVLVARAGEDVWAFVLALFVPYFVFSAVETSFVHSLRGNKGTTA